MNLNSAYTYVSFRSFSFHIPFKKRPGLPFGITLCRCGIIYCCTAMLTSANWGFGNNSWSCLTSLHSIGFRGTPATYGILQGCLATAAYKNAYAQCVDRLATDVTHKVRLRLPFVRIHFHSYCIPPAAGSCDFASLFLQLHYLLSQSATA